MIYISISLKDEKKIGTQQLQWVVNLLFSTICGMKLSLQSLKWREDRPNTSSKLMLLFSNAKILLRCLFSLWMEKHRWVIQCVEWSITIHKPSNLELLCAFSRFYPRPFQAVLLEEQQFLIVAVPSVAAELWAHRTEAQQVFSPIPMNLRNLPFEDVPSMNL